MRNSLFVMPLTLSVALLGACAQLTTNDSERAALQQAAQAEAAEYLECIRRETRTFAGNNVTADYVSQTVTERCAGALADYEADEYAHLKSMFMMPDQMLAEDVDELNRQARNIVAEEMAAFGTAGSAPAAIAPAAAAGGAAVAASSSPAPAAAAPAAGNDRVYLDCVESQAKRFAALEESAETIAEVAHNRCAKYAGANAAALAASGRALALDTVFEARLPSP